MKSNHRFWKWRKATAALLVVGALLGTPCLPSALPTVSAAETIQAQALQSPRWDATVRQGINDFIAAYGKDSPNYDKNNHPYAVFDFDNTTSILDVGEQLEVWQLDHLQFAVPPTQMKAVLMTGIPTDKLDAICAAVSYFKVPGVKDVLAMTNKVDANGRYLNQYDYDLHPQTQGVGKAETLAKILVPKYKGHGPSFTAMDSQGDFNFCTEFKDTKEVLVINRTRTDDAALCAGIAAYQKKHGIDLAAANKNGDSLFLIQGRNENKGEFWNDDKTLLLGKKDASYLSDKATKAETELEQGKTIAQVLKDNTKLKDKYQGYKTR